MLALMLFHKTSWDFGPVLKSCTGLCLNWNSELEATGDAPVVPFGDWSIPITQLFQIKAGLDAKATIELWSKVSLNPAVLCNSRHLQETSGALTALWCEFSLLFICGHIFACCPSNSPAPPGRVALGCKGKRRKNIWNRHWKNKN